MKKTVILYLIIGFLFGLFVMLFMGSNSGNPVGKYQVVVTRTQDPILVTTILDTETGIAKQWEAHFTDRYMELYMYNYREKEVIRIKP